MITGKNEQNFIAYDIGISFTILNNNILRLRNVLSAAEKLTFIVLASHAGVNRTECFPSYKTISEEVGITRRRIIDVVESLIKKRFLIKTTRKGKYKNSYTNLYTLTFPGDLNMGGSEIVSPPSEIVSPNNYIFKRSLKKLNKEKSKAKKPKKDYNKNKPANVGNFEQRTYSDEFYDSLYENTRSKRGVFNERSDNKPEPAGRDGNNSNGTGSGLSHVSDSSENGHGNIPGPVFQEGRQEKQRQRPVNKVRSNSKRYIQVVERKRDEAPGYLSGGYSRRQQRQPQSGGSERTLCKSTWVYFRYSGFQGYGKAKSVERPGNKETSRPIYTKKQSVSQYNTRMFVLRRE